MPSDKIMGNNLLESFYKALNKSLKAMVDTITGEAFMFLL